jgi:tetratricopeptide (TPR) repeat protein
MSSQVKPVPNPDYIARLQKAIRDHHGCDSEHSETVSVHEQFQGHTIWRGEIEVFELKGNPNGARRELTYALQQHVSPGLFTSGYWNECCSQAHRSREPWWLNRGSVEIYAAAKKWEAALDIAAALVQLEPENSQGWLHRSYCLHELKRTTEARENLLPVLEKFPNDAIMRYNLACYECQLGNLERAKQWLEKAFQLGEPTKTRLMALDDPDLEPLWKHIGEL